MFKSYSYSSMGILKEYHQINVQLIDSPINLDIHGPTIQKLQNNCQGSIRHLLALISCQVDINRKGIRQLKEKTKETGANS